jgi:ABC-type multidrug transport system fused ATPase/permease subunit
MYNETENKFTFTLRKRLFAALLRQDYSFYLLNDAGDLNARLDSTFRVAHTLIDGMVEVTGCASSIYAHGAFAYSIYPQYLSVIGAFGFGGALVLYVLLRMVYHGDHALCRRSEKVMKHAREKARTEVKNLKTVREYSREATSKKEFKQRLKSQGNAELQRRIVQFAMWPICCTFIEVGLQVGNWMLARELNAGRITVAEFVSLGEMLYHIVFMTRHLMEKIPEMFAIQEPLNRIFTVMETVSNVEPMAGNAPKPKMTEVKFTGKFNEAGEPQFEPLVEGEKPVIDITFENVNFSYPNNPERQILDTLSLRAVGGKSTAFVGKSGCGKTTTIQLIKRFFDPEIGKVIVNGLPLATWDVRDYRSLMATVAQGVQLKEGTIRENLMYGMSESQQVEFESQGMAEADKILQKYCELACCWDNCIKELPLQFETRLGESEGCIQLSGGQQACVAIARALIREPQLLILDEATAPLDAKTQEKVAKNIYDLQTERGMTVIMIAHRLDTLKACDAIFFFMYGSVVEGAGLDTLNRDAYKEMVAMRVTHAKTFVYDEGDDKFTGKEKSVVRSGRFKAQWNIDNDTKEYDEMDLADLDKEKEK